MLAAIPVTTTLAGVGLVIFVSAVLVPPFRRGLMRHLQMPMPSTGRPLAPLDSFRGLAALWIALFHFWSWPTIYHPTYEASYFANSQNLFPIIHEGSKAVSIFVILSGFLIWRSVKRIETKSDLARYTWNRFFRVFPLYAVVIAVLFVSGQLGHVMPPLQNLVAEIVMSQAFGSRVFVIPQTWSLYVEVIFYLAAPMMMAWFGRRALLAALAGVVLFTLADYPTAPAAFSLWKHFFFGIAAAELHERYAARISQYVAPLVLAAGLFLVRLDVVGGYDWAAAVAQGTGFDLHKPEAPFYSFGLGLGFTLTMLGTLWWTPASWLLSIAPLRILGAISYSVFMWHTVILLADLPMYFSGSGAPLIDHAALPPSEAPTWSLYLVVIPALITAGILSFILIERPSLMRRPRSGQYKVRNACGTDCGTSA